MKGQDEVNEHRKTLFPHDCTACLFLGTYNKHDLYFCPNGVPTVIARFGGEPEKYLSGMPFALTSVKKRITEDRTLFASVVALRVARLVAIDMGYDMKER